jgi:hypothetical protein
VAHSPSDALARLPTARTTKTSCGPRAKHARRPKESVRALPGSDDARRVLVNALRIFGEVDRGREIAAGLQDRASPETAYTLATLDLVSPAVAPESAAARLRQNAWVAGIPGKSRAALVYALVRSGDLDGANTELDKLALLARLHPRFGGASRAHRHDAIVGHAAARARAETREALHYQALPRGLSRRGTRTRTRSSAKR